MWLFLKNIYVWIILGMLSSGLVYGYAKNIEISNLEKMVDKLSKELNLSKAETTLSVSEVNKCKLTLAEQNLAIEKLRIENVSLSEKERKNLAEIRKLRVKPKAEGVREYYEEIFDSLNNINRN